MQDVCNFFLLDKKSLPEKQILRKTLSLFWGFLICYFGELTYSEIKQLLLYYTPPPHIFVNLYTFQTFESLSDTLITISIKKLYRIFHKKARFSRMKKERRQAFPSYVILIFRGSDRFLSDLRRSAALRYIPRFLYTQAPPRG